MSGWGHSHNVISCQVSDGHAPPLVRVIPEALHSKTSGFEFMHAQHFLRTALGTPALPGDCTALRSMDVIAEHAQELHHSCTSLGMWQQTRVAHWRLA